MMRWTAAATALAGLAGPGLPVAGPAVAQEPVEINIIQPANRSMLFWPIHVGEMLGYFEEEGISVNLIASDPTIPYVLFLASRDADLALLDSVQAIQAIDAGFEIVNVYAAHHQAPQGVYVLDSSPLYDVAQLKGKTVGLAADRDRAFLEIAMAHAGATADDIETVVVGDAGPVLASVFLNGVADAFAGSEIALAALEAQSIEVRDIARPSTVSPPSNTYAMLASRIEELRGPMCGFLRAWSKGVYIGQQDIEIVAAMSRHPDGVPEQWESPEFGYLYLHRVDDLVIPSAGRFGEMDPAAWRAVQDDMLLVGEIGAERDVSAFLSDAYLDCANDFDRAQVMAEAQAWMDDPANAEYVWPAAP